MWICIAGLAFIYEIIDSATGQGYGTLSTPTLMLLGFNALYIVPCVLLSQAFSGFVGGMIHHKIGNFDVKNNIKDRVNTEILVVLGCIGVLVGVYVLSKLPSIIISTYIGILVVIMGIIIVVGFTFHYSKIKMVIISVFACFNKGLSGGGYGPVSTGGQLVLGSETKNAVGVTTIAEAPICITGFVMWCILNNQLPPFDLLSATVIGALFAPLIGARLTKTAHTKFGNKFTKIIGVIILILGIYTLYKIFK